MSFPPSLAHQPHPVELEHQARFSLTNRLLKPPSFELLVNRPLHSGFHLQLKLLKLLLQMDDLSKASFG